MSALTDVFVATPADIAGDDLWDRLVDDERRDALLPIQAKNLDQHGLPQLQELLLGIPADEAWDFTKAEPARYAEETGAVVFALPEALTQRLATANAEELARIDALFGELVLDDDALRSAFAVYRARRGLPPSDRVRVGADLVHVACEAHRSGRQLYLHLHGY